MVVIVFANDDGGNEPFADLSRARLVHCLRCRSHASDRHDCSAPAARAIRSQPYHVNAFDGLPSKRTAPAMRSRT
jgi:hypothetical protein